MPPKKSAPPKHKYVFRLFVTGMTPQSRRAIENTRELCEKYLKGQYSLEIVDIYQHPEAASENQLIASPTLIKQLPLPLRRFVGDMSKTQEILVDLRVDPKPEE